MSILSERQQLVLRELSRESLISQHFYLTGGTALAEYYLQHRLSEDLDFFTEEEVDPQVVFVALRKIQATVGFVEVKYEQSFNRNLYFLIFHDEVIKTEFTYFPFLRIERKKKIGDLEIDSLEDIAVNKLFTIYQKPRARDFIDLYLAMKQQGWTMSFLIKQVKAKFDQHIDSLQLGSRFLEATDVKDFPRMLIQLDSGDWQSFYIEEAKKLAGTFLK